MGEEISNTGNLEGLNLDLSLLPTNYVVLHNVRSMNPSESPRRTRQPYFSQRYVHSSFGGETHIPVELSQSANGAALLANEDIIAGEERVNNDSKKCENKVTEEDNVTEEKRVIEKSNGSNSSFFDCYICLDLSKEPVVTNCGHLYCWSCLYQWLQVSVAKECPVCKGEVSVKTLTPIYGCGGNKRKFEKLSDTKIPPRPQAKRVESLRTSLQRSGYVPTEMMRNLQERLERELSSGERRTRPFLNRFMTSRGVRAEQNQSSVAVLDDNNTVLTSNIEEESGRMLFSDVFLSSTEILMEDFMTRQTLGRNQEQNSSYSVGVEDRDSFSSIVGVINSENQVDTAAEIDSMLNSTSSSVSRQENRIRVSDVDSSDSRPLRRRRLA